MSMQAFAGRLLEPLGLMALLLAVFQVAVVLGYLLAQDGVHHVLHFFPDSKLLVRRRKRATPD